MKQNLKNLKVGIRKFDLALSYVFISASLIVGTVFFSICAGVSLTAAPNGTNFLLFCCFMNLVGLIGFGQYGLGGPKK